ncbi:spermidine/putrescine ABC transporter ATP-binding protein PotA [Paraferrimonas sp. SM1919]|uniref:spermidine/putrescine ABC transporter ATP-binding protein PotA n=1 Tax=Paraferrimonas sp. SM1919 TaxID=2662263 RepID=UPI0013D20567|nr:spermidine/putrescine ABC transporter ATP-binding protein PotA [Paraferrimonas sp. SM1919]
MPNNTAKAIVTVDNLSINYSSKNIIDNLSLNIYDGEFLTLLGPSGCGKTTLLRLIAGLETATSGKIFLDGKDVTSIPAEQRRVNTVFQNYALFPHMSVLENVMFGLNIAKVDKNQAQQRAEEALNIVKLSEHMHKRPHQLSGGQQQRVAIARAVVNQPKVLLLDESLSALDYKLRKQMQTELKQLQRKLGITFIFVTHDQEEALSMSDRIVVLRDGIIEQIGSPKEIYETPVNMFVAEFIGESNVFKAQVIRHVSQREYLANINGKTFPIHSDIELQPEQPVQILLRPEDIRITELKESEDSSLIIGHVLERTYKGMTLDSVVETENGQTILVSEFFDEDDPDTDHSIGQKVAVTWVPSWEVVLPYEN